MRASAAKARGLAVVDHVNTEAMLFECDHGARKHLVVWQGGEPVGCGGARLVGHGLLLVACGTQRVGLEAPTRIRQWPGESKLHLRLHAGGARQAAVGCLIGQVLQQRGFAHAGFAANHDRPALAGADGRDQAVQHLAFAAPADQRRSVTRNGVRYRHRCAPTLQPVPTGHHDQPLGDGT